MLIIGADIDSAALLRLIPPRFYESEGELFVSVFHIFVKLKEYAMTKFAHIVNSHPRHSGESG